MDVKIYVGNLPYSTSDADLKDLFSQVGKVKTAQVIKDRQSGRSKGFAFVEMSSEEEAQKAITLFHGRDYSGRPLTVNIARPREERSGTGGYRGSGSGRAGKGSSHRLPGDSYTDAPSPGHRPSGIQSEESSQAGDGTTDPPDA